MRSFVGLVLGAVIAGLVGLGFVLDRVVPPASDAPSADGPAAATAGAWVCAAGGTDEGSSVEVVAAAPPREGGAPATLAIAPFGDGSVLEREVTQVFPDSSLSTGVDDGISDVGVLARWWDVPAAVSRIWTIDTQGMPGGIVAGPCQSRPSSTWTVPGVATAGGAQSKLVLANPFQTAASVAIELTTPDGLIRPKRLENVVVPARSTTSISFNEHAPEQPDLGAIVRSRSGRVYAEAVQTFDAAIGGVEGTSLVAASAQPHESWTIPSVAVGADASSWLWVTNPSDEPAALLLTLHTPSGGLVPEGLEEVIIDPGTTQRIELVGLLDEETSHAGVTVSSDNGVPVVVAAATQFTAQEAQRTGITVALGTPALDDTWVLTAGPTEGRKLIIDLADPAADPATVDVAIWNGAGLARPEELQGLRVPAGGSRAVDVTEHLAEATGSVTVFVTTGEGQVAAGLRAYAVEGRRDAVAFIGVPASVFERSLENLTVDFAPELPVRIGTRLGPTEDDALLHEDVGADLGAVLPDG